jgi:hypothetical protein
LIIDALFTIILQLFILLVLDVVPWNKTQFNYISAFVVELKEISKFSNEQ